MHFRHRRGEQVLVGLPDLAEVNDKDYDSVRAMYATVGVPKFSGFLGE